MPYVLRDQAIELGYGSSAYMGGARHFSRWWKGGQGHFQGPWRGGQTIFQGIISALCYIERDGPNASVRTTSLLPLLNRYFSSTLVSV